MDVPGTPSWRSGRGVGTFLGRGRWYFSIASLEACFEHVRSLALEFPNFWGLMCRAQVRCRREHFSRLRRKLAAKFAMGGEGAFSPNRPCGFVFRAPAEGDTLWTREVCHPAIHVIPLTPPGGGHAPTGADPRKAPLAVTVLGLSPPVFPSVLSQCAPGTADGLRIEVFKHLPAQTRSLRSLAASTWTMSASLPFLSSLP